MKRIRLIVATVLLFSGLDCFAALPICAKSCDVHWTECLKGCAEGSDGLRCRNICAEQHEGCLNACRSGASLNSDSGGQLFALRRGDSGHDGFFSQRSVTLR